MKPIAADLENRRRAWEALASLYLDTDTSLSRRWRARILAASPYSLKELDCILIDEIDPACRANLLSVAGEWAGFDLQWLEGRILQQSRSAEFIPRFTFTRCSIPCSIEWRATRDEIAKLRTK